MTKMVIVVRRDLHIRKGKEIAQACHGAVNIILKALDRDGLPWYTVGDGRIVVDGDSALSEWFSDSYTKVCLYVDSEDELLNLKNIEDKKKYEAILAKQEIQRNQQQSYEVITDVDPVCSMNILFDNIGSERS